MQPRRILGASGLTGRRDSSAGHNVGAEQPDAGGAEAAVAAGGAGAGPGAPAVAQVAEQKAEPREAFQIACWNEEAHASPETGAGESGVEKLVVLGGEAREAIDGYMVEGDGPRRAGERSIGDLQQAFAPGMSAASIFGRAKEPFEKLRGEVHRSVTPDRIRQTTSLYRHDLALAVAPDLPKDPHVLFYFPTTASGEVIARAAQSEMVGFLATDSFLKPDVNHLVSALFGRELFGVPQFLPEDLNY